MGVDCGCCCGWMASAVSPSTSGPGTLGRSFVGGWDGGALNGGFGRVCVFVCNGAGMCGLCLSCGGGLVVSGIGNVALGIGYQRLGVVVLKFGFIPWTKLGFGWGGRGG